VGGGAKSFPLGGGIDPLVTKKITAKKRKTLFVEAEIRFAL